MYTVFFPCGWLHRGSKKNYLPGIYHDPRNESSGFLVKIWTGRCLYCDELLWAFKTAIFQAHIENWVSSQNINDSSIILGWNGTSKDRLIAALARIYKARPSRPSEGIIISWDKPWSFFFSEAFKMRYQLNPLRGALNYLEGDDEKKKWANRQQHGPTAQFWA